MIFEPVNQRYSYFMKTNKDKSVKYGSEALVTRETCYVEIVQ